MKKTEIEKTIKSITRKHTDTLTGICSTLDGWTDNHGKVKSSFFWTPSTSASSRRWEEKKKSFVGDLVLGDLHLVYASDCSCSCKHYYWKDSLSGTLDGVPVSVTFGDVSKIMDGIGEILQRRKSA